MFEDRSNFSKNFIKDGSIYLNDKFGVFIITGSNYNLFYYYDVRDNTMNQLQSLKNNHSHGGMVIHPKSSSIICLSGFNTRAVERYSDNLLIKGFKKISNRVKPAYENQWYNLPELKTDRSRAGYIIVNDIIYAFFGYSQKTNSYCKTIERLDLNKDYIGSYFGWEEIKYSSNKSKFDPYLTSFYCVENIFNNEIILIGGFDSNEQSNEKILSYKIGEKNLEIEFNYKNSNFNFEMMQESVPFLKDDKLFNYSWYDERGSDALLIIEPKTLVMKTIYS